MYQFITFHHHIWPYFWSNAPHDYLAQLEPLQQCFPKGLIVCGQRSWKAGSTPRVSMKAWSYDRWRPLPGVPIPQPIEEYFINVDVYIMGIYGTCWYQVWEQGVRSPRILTLLILYFQFIFLCKEILKIRVFNGFCLNLLSINVSLLGSWVMKERICEDFRGATFVNIGWSHGFLSFGLSFSPSFFHGFHLVPFGSYFFLAFFLSS